MADEIVFRRLENGLRSATKGRNRRLSGESRSNWRRCRAVRASAAGLTGRGGMASIAWREGAAGT